MMQKRFIALSASILICACGGNKGAVSQNAQNESAANDFSAQTADEAQPEQENAPSANETLEGPEKPVEETEEAKDDSENAAFEQTDETEAPSKEAPAAAQNEAPPSGDLQSYVGTKAYSPEYRTVRENMAAVKQCYLDAMRVDPDLQGTLTVRFTVTKKGTVKKATAVKNELNDWVADCVISILKNLKFPNRADNRTVEYPFSFVPGP
jgi:cobalamin biosynthesis protein CobT